AGDLAWKRVVGAGDDRDPRLFGGQGKEDGGLAQGLLQRDRDNGDATIPAERRRCGEGAGQFGDTRSCRRASRCGGGARSRLLEFVQPAGSQHFELLLVVDVELVGIALIHSPPAERSRTWVLLVVGAAVARPGAQQTTMHPAELHTLASSQRGPGKLG